MGSDGFGIQAEFDYKNVACTFSVRVQLWQQHAVVCQRLTIEQETFEKGGKEGARYWYSTCCLFQCMNVFNYPPSDLKETAVQYCGASIVQPACIVDPETVSTPPVD